MFVFTIIKKSIRNMKSDPRIVTILWEVLSHWQTMQQISIFTFPGNEKKLKLIQISPETSGVRYTIIDPICNVQLSNC